MICERPVFVPSRMYGGKHKYYKQIYELSTGDCSQISEDKWINVPCNKCISCLMNKRGDWTFRLTQELKYAKSAIFLTLTYNDENLPTSGVNKRHVQLFLKRLRAYQDKNLLLLHLKDKWPKIAYFLVGEYGETTNRSHYHAIIFNIEYYTKLKLEDIWGMGQIHIGTVTTASIHYTLKYMINNLEFPEGKEPPFSLMSRNPGLGNKYLAITTKYHKDNMKFTARSNKGYEQRLPRYYKDRIFNKYHREQYGEEMRTHFEMLYDKEVSRYKKSGMTIPEIVKKIEQDEQFMITVRNLKTIRNSKSNKL